jgi:hypothetical protein
LAHSSAQQPAAAGEAYPPSLDYNSSSSSSSAASTSTSYHPPVPTSVHKHSSAKSEAEPADVERNAKAQTTEKKKNESDEPSLTASGLRVIDAPRPEGATEQMTKEEEFEFYKKKMEQLNREKEDTNARFLKEEREKQKLLDKQHKKPSVACTPALQATRERAHVRADRRRGVWMVFAAAHLFQGRRGGRGRVRDRRAAGVQARIAHRLDARWRL